MSDSDPSESSRSAPPRTWWPTGLAQATLLLWAVYRGFRIPGPWSLNYYQVSWFDGFARRGFLGSLLSPLGCARFDPRVIWSAQFVVLACALVLLFWLGRRGTAALFLCLFFASDAGAFFFNEVGYPDQLLLLLTVGCVVFLKRGFFLAAPLVAVLAVLVHEMAVFTLAPVVLVVWMRLPKSGRPVFAGLFGPAALAAGIMACCPSVSPSNLARYLSAASACGHPLARLDFFGDYQQSFRQVFGWHYNGWELCLQIVPLTAALAWWITGGAAIPGLNRKERWAVLAAACCPLLLGFVAWDTGRWIYLVLIQTLLLISVVDSGSGSSRSGNSAIPGIVRVLPLACVLLLLRIPLFDGFVSRPLSTDGIRSFRATTATGLMPAPK